MEKLTNEINYIVDCTLEKRSYLTKKDFVRQFNNLKKTIISEVNHFNLNKEYYEIYCAFRESIDSGNLYIFTDFLDIAARSIIDEIYQNIDNLNQIEISDNLIKNASSKKRKHYAVAKDIAISVIKVYSLNPKSEKRIVDYIDDLLPSNYTKDSDIDLVIWYFLVCIVTFKNSL